MKLVLALAALVVAAAVVAPSAMAAPAKGPVIVYKDKRFGTVLFTRGYRALYFWNVEVRSPGKIKCTGACAVAWPPLIVRSAAAVPKKIPGARGTFGTIRRPDGRLQVTYNRWPIYTYAHEGPRQILCDDVGGWFVVRVRP